MKIALFTHHFLEPTHHAIAQLIGALTDCRFSVFSKRFENHFAFENVVERTMYWKGPIPQIRATAFDLVHAIYDGKTAIRAYAAAAEAGIPFVLSFHGGFDIHAKILDVRYREATRAICEAASVVSVPCAADRQRLMSIGVRRVAVVLPVPVVIGATKSQRAPDQRRLLAVGRLIPKKGIDTAIQAMVELPEHMLDIIGTGELELELRALIEKLGLQGRVRLLGQLTLQQVESCMLRSFALLHPARVATDGNAEGTAQIILHAQGLGLPVIATNTGSLGEIVQDGRTGIVIPPNSPSALAAAVRTLTASPDLQEFFGGLPEAGERSISAVAEQMRRIYTAAATGIRLNE